MIYLDNAATSFPKPPEVAAAISDFLLTSAGNPGRSGHSLALAAQAVVAAGRRSLARLVGVADPERVAFALNGTDAVNQALWGLLGPGDRVVSTSMEHNAVARPLHALAGLGVDVVQVACAPDGTLDPTDVERELRAAPTRLLVMTHASNVCGALLPVAEVTRLAHQHGTLVLVDAAQTAGVIPLDVHQLGVDLLAAPGHKGLRGPTGTGLLYVAPEVRLRPLRQGGTGSASEQLAHPGEMPELLEAGTVNTVGIAGLAAAVEVLQRQGVDAVHARENTLTTRLLDGLFETPGVHIHGPSDPSQRVAVVSVSLDGWEPTDAAAALDASFDIAVRAGLHCAPLAHRTLGTYPAGTVRLSLGPLTTEDEIDRTLDAFRELSGSPS